MTWGQVIWWAASSVISWAMQPKIPDTTVTQTGARLSDLKVQSSALGQAIPKIYGTMRTAGNMIWSRPIKETTHVDSQTQEGGGKGGGGGGSQTVTTTTYSYSQTFAIAVCEGPISGVRKIWANGELVYNAGDDATMHDVIASNAASAGVVFYLGSETQLPSPIIQAYEGAANTQAYRGTAYVVFDDLQLERFGNRTPNLEFEVVANGVVSYPTVDSRVCDTDPDWTTATWGTIGAYNGAFWCFINGGHPSFSAISYDGETWTRGPSHGDFTLGMYVMWANGRFVCFGGQYDQHILQSFDGLTWTACTTPASAHYHSMAYGGGVFVGVGFDGSGYRGLGVTRDLVTWQQAYMTGLSDAVTWKQVVWIGSGFLAFGDHLYPPYAFQSAFSPTGEIGTWVFGPMNTTAITGFITMGWNGSYAIAIDDNGRVWRCDDYLNWTQIVASGNCRSEGPVWSKGRWVTRGGGYYGLLESLDDGITWTGIDSGITYKGSFVAQDGVLLGAGTASHVLHIAKIYDQALSSSGVALSSVVSNIITSSSHLTVADINVTALASDTVSGYAITQRQSGRASLEPLMQMFFFDCVESDYKLKFVKRGGSVAVSIPEDDLAAHAVGSDLPDPLGLTRIQEVELPREVSVQYLAADASYQTGAQYGRRIITTSQLAQSRAFTASLTDTKAKQIADVLCHQPWVGRNKFTFSTSMKYAQYEPTDVVQLTNGSITYTTRITNRNEANGILTWEAESEDTSIYTQTGAASATPVPPVTIRVPGPTCLQLLDIPCLREADNTYGFYVAACGYLDGWSGAQMYKSSDSGGSWAQTGVSVLNASAMGSASEALATFVGGNMFDEKNTVSVKLIDGTLSSITEAQVLAGGNACIIGSELLQFRAATLTATDTYTLSGLLRGRRGTEWAMGTHVAGDRFVMLTATTTYNQADPSSDTGIPRLYRAASFGTYLTSAASVAFTDNAVRLECLSPVGIGGGRDASGNLTINWIRRARLGAEWRDYVDVPVGETAESYEIDVMSGATVKRTITATTNTASYTAAQQTTDFGSPQSSILVNIYQMSAAVGRGYVGVATI
jgi:hypothetical protein